MQGEDRPRTTIPKSSRSRGAPVLEDALTGILGLASREIRPDQGLVNRKVATCATNEFVRRI